MGVCGGGGLPFEKKMNVCEMGLEPLPGFV